ncbi:MAG: hypothetical protein LBD52_02270 [Prevotellaceae bacterium]|nr:hypothetical protein [Prevotellaceae bacterium]
MKSNFAKALSTAQLAIINTGNRAVYRAFKRLHTHQAQAVAYASCSTSNLPEVLALCARSKVFTVVLGAAPDKIFTTPSSVAVIAPSVSFEDSYLRGLLRPAAQRPMATPCTPAPFEAPCVPEPVQPVWLTDFSALAFQTYLTPASVLEDLDNCYFETLRLGAFRNNPAAAEPVLRDADYVWFDLSAVRASDAPSTAHPGPNGLYAEEACQLGHYIGLSNRAKALFLFGYKPYLCASSRTAQLAGQLLWHVAEAAATRIYEKIEAGVASRPEFKEIIVDMGQQGQALHFVNSLTTRRWWIKVPVTKASAQWISCLPTDYDTACRGEIPLRWLWYYQKLNY